MPGFMLEGVGLDWWSREPVVRVSSLLRRAILQIDSDARQETGAREPERKLRFAGDEP